MKKLSSIFIIGLILLTTKSTAQQVIFTDSFEQPHIDSTKWTVVSGKWKIGDVEQLRIAPAEKGYQHILCAGGKGAKDEQQMRLIVDLPESVRSGSLILSFYYDLMDNTSSASIEVEFYEKEIKDGLRGKPMILRLPVNKGRWIEYKKKFIIPHRANSFQVVLIGSAKEKKVCFDVFRVSVKSQK